MKFTHKAPKGEKKVSERIIEGTNSPGSLAKTLELYKRVLDCKPPKGARAGYKEASKCETCHNEQKEKKPGAHKPETPAP